MQNAFKECDGTAVPLLWNHDHNDAKNVLGHALLENKEDGVYAYGYFNDTDTGKRARELVQHGDITGLSIYANKLQQNGGNVYHGKIRELSLVYATANPGAYIEDVIAHGDSDETDAIIYTGMGISLPADEELEHKDKEPEEPKKEEQPKSTEESKEMAENQDNGKTIKEIFETLNDEQKQMVYALVGIAAEQNGKGDGEEMKHNAFESEYNEAEEYALMHSEFASAVEDMQRYGSLRESVIQHGIENIGELFPEPKALNNPPEWINVKTDWVSRVMNGVHHTPFSRIKSSYADIRGDEARALGYIKGKYKKEEVFTLLKRTTEPTTVYKKQKFDRDDVIDITDFEVIPWVKNEMRGKLDEELARAFLIGDGRLPDSDDKIKEDKIRPIWKDDDLFTIKYTLADEKPATFIRGAIKARIDYRGSGQPVLFITEDKLTDLLLMTDATGRDIYDSEQKLATKLRVSAIITVPVMENAGVRVDTKTGKAYKLHGLIVNLSDYNVGADKGGAINWFDDFNIDYNKMIYLIETRCSGALIKPYSAIALETETAPPAEAE